jgi:hypothetical protein
MLLLVLMVMLLLMLLLVLVLSLLPLLENCEFEPVLSAKCSAASMNILSRLT